MSIVKELQDQIKEIHEKIVDIQENCNHPESALEKKGNSSTGNWDPMDNCYWWEFHCKLCDKRWTKEQ
jgi:hypothetical protein